MSSVSSLFLKTRYHSVNLVKLLKQQSTLKIIFTILFAVCFEIGIFMLFIDSFEYLGALGGIGLIIIDKLFALFFFGMGFMLVTSGIISSFSTIYRSEEIPFLMVRPFPVSQIVIYKFFESTGLSSWAFFFIIIPFVAAYGYHENITTAFALWNLLFAIPFLVICSGIGTAFVLVMVRWFPLGKYLKYLLVGLGIMLVLLLVYYIKQYSYNSDSADLNLASLLPGFRVSSHPLLPSQWVSEGIAALTHGEWFRGFMFWMLVVSTAILVCIIIECFGANIFYDGWQRLAGSSSNKSRPPEMLVWLQNTLSLFPHDIRAIVMKDIRTFLRDPVQWSQVLIFFGLLALYFSNLRTFKYHTFPENWRNTVAFLNVFSVSAVMCSLGSRFIYPQLSLEGQGFWFLGLSPTKMSRILLTKFITSLLGMLFVSVGLMFLSSRMLNATPLVTWITILLASAISCAVCGLSTGLGAIYLDINQRNPTAIVSGFGGTLNLILSLGFMLAAILPFGMVFHQNFVHKMNQHYMLLLLIMAGLWLIVLTVLTVCLPLHLGCKALVRREY